jgi:hypothetical protein
MDAVIIVLRLVHIVGGVFWAGSTFFTEGFMAPMIALSGPEGGRFMERLMTQTRFGVAISLAAILTQLSGLILYWRDSQLSDGWAGSGPGIGFAIGGLAGLLTLIPVFAMLRPAGDRMLELGRQLQAAGGPPSPELLAEMEVQQQRRTMGGRISALLLIISVIFMAIAPYLG